MICSGMQTGVDIAALIVAERFGLKTIGYAPKGYLTESGLKPAIGKHFGIKEIEIGGYRGYIVRTYMNVELGDGTIRIANNFESPGEVCTLNGIKKYKKPYIDININSPILVDEVAKWVVNNGVKILNVAGNRESKSPGIKKFTEEYLTKVLKELGYEIIHS